jgi:hypothetical protein
MARQQHRLLPLALASLLVLVAATSAEAARPHHDDDGDRTAYPKGYL